MLQPVEADHGHEPTAETAAAQAFRPQATSQRTQRNLVLLAAPSTRRRSLADGLRADLDRAAKRALDVAGAGLGLIVLAPLLAGTMVLIALVDGRPVLFRQ